MAGCGAGGQRCETAEEGFDRGPAQVVLGREAARTLGGRKAPEHAFGDIHESAHFRDALPGTHGPILLQHDSAQHGGGVKCPERDAR